MRNRNMERIYMEKLREIESVIWVLVNKKEKYEKEIYQLKRPYAELEIPRMEEVNYQESVKMGGAYLFASFLAAIVGGFLNWVFEFFEEGAFASGFNITIKILLIIFVILVILGVCNLNKECKKNEEEYSWRIREYNRQKEINETQYKENCLVAAKKEKDLVKLNAEIGQAEKIRSELYSVNWIAGRYRDIRVIYYMCDMVLTSEITMDESLKYFLLQEANDKLDALLRKMDVLIEQQSAIIAGQAVLKAQNAEIIENERAMISKIGEMENNLELASDYARISTSYAEASAYFSLATYLKN